MKRAATHAAVEGITEEHGNLTRLGEADRNQLVRFLQHSIFLNIAHCEGSNFLLLYREGVFVLARCAFVILCSDVGKYVVSDVWTLRYVVRGLKFETTACIMACVY